ncbi:aldehyde dehydrogenase family protein, partial [Vibrio cholerae O1]|nr:aldehyde dehydrogenase family protein [Vibrio cholerae O1]
LDKVAALVDDAVSGGATVLTGGGKIDGPGFFFDPTVITNVPAGSEIRTTEIFGPVAPIVTFDTDEEAIALAN